MTKTRIGKGSDYNLREIKDFVDDFVEENWGRDRATANVDYYASKLTVSVVIVDKVGRPDKALLTPSMKQEMKEAAKDLLKGIERRFGIKMEQVSLSGNLIGLEKWDQVGTWVAREILQIAKELASIG